MDNSKEEEKKLLTGCRGTIESTFQLSLTLILTICGYTKDFSSNYLYSIRDIQDNQINLDILMPISMITSAISVLRTVLVLNLKWQSESVGESLAFAPSVIVGTIFRIWSFVLAFTYLNIWSVLILGILWITNFIAMASLGKPWQGVLVCGFSSLASTMTAVHVSNDNSCQARRTLWFTSMTSLATWFAPLIITFLIILDILPIHYEQRSIFDRSRAVYNIAWTLILGLLGKVKPR